MSYVSFLNIINILTLLSADAKSAVLLRVPSLTKDKVHNFPLQHFPTWLCLIRGQLDLSLQRVKRSVIYICQCFFLFDIHQFILFPTKKFSPRRDSAKCQLLRLFSEFSRKCRKHYSSLYL